MRALSLLGIVALSALCACGSAGGTDDPLADGAGGAGGSAGGSAAGAGGASANGGSAGSGINAGGSGSGSGADCGGDVSKAIYVVASPENMLLSFDPVKLTFTQIGKLACSKNGSTPFSMAVNRAGIAYVLYDDGNIYKASTKDASCTTSGYKANQQGWSTFGMGYVSDTAGSSAETLFVMDGSTGSGKGLAYISSAGVLTPVGQFDKLAGRSGEVTGTGDGKLFGFFVDITDASKTTVAEVEKTNAKILSDVKQGLPAINAWAFAHWGGSFYLFNGTGNEPSRVNKYTPGKGTTLVVPNAGYRIVGAGVSTCAPTVEPPK